MGDVADGPRHEPMVTTDRKVRIGTCSNHVYVAVMDDATRVEQQQSALVSMLVTLTGTECFAWKVTWHSLMMLCRTCKYTREWAWREIHGRARMLQLPFFKDRTGIKRLSIPQRLYEYTSSVEMLIYMKQYEGMRARLACQSASNDLLLRVLAGEGVKDVAFPDVVKDRSVIACMKFGQVVDTRTFHRISEECGWECIQMAREKLGWEVGHSEGVLQQWTMSAVRHENTTALEEARRDWIVFSVGSNESFAEVVTYTAAREGRIGVLQWMVDHGTVLETRLVHVAAKGCVNGDCDEETLIATLEYLLGHITLPPLPASDVSFVVEPFPETCMTEKACEKLLVANMLKAAQWMHRHMPLRVVVSCVIVRLAPLRCVEYVVNDPGCQGMDGTVLYNAVLRLDTDILDCITKAVNITEAWRAECVQCTIQDVPKRGNKWRQAFAMMYRCDIKPDECDMAYAAGLNLTKVMKYMYDQGCAIDVKTLLKAAKHRQRNAIEVALDLGLTLCRATYKNIVFHNPELHMCPPLHLYDSTVLGFKTWLKDKVDDGTDARESV